MVSRAPMISISASRPAVSSRPAGFQEPRVFDSGMRSCGLRGPATQGSTPPRSSSSTSEYSVSPPWSERNSPCSLQYLSTRSTSSCVRPVSLRYASVFSSTGKNPPVAPYSGDMFAIVALSATLRSDNPGPKNSTIFSTTPCARSICVTVSTRSVAVTPSRSAPRRRIPTTSGTSMYRGCPSRAASASIPPTPHPRTPIPQIMVVWESVPTTVSGNATPSLTSTTRARSSRFTW